MKRLNYLGGHSTGQQPSLCLDLVHGSVMRVPPLLRFLNINKNFGNTTDASVSRENRSYSKDLLDASRSRQALRHLFLTPPCLIAHNSKEVKRKRHDQ